MNIRYLLALSCLSAGFAVAESPVIRTPVGTVSFSPENGAIVAVSPAGSTGSVWQSGESGLWSARFADKTTIDASLFCATNAVRAFSWKPGPSKDSLILLYMSTALTVRVTASTRIDGVELSAEVTPATQPLLQLDLPGRLRFAPASVTRFVCPLNGNTASGAAFNHNFFERQPEERPSGWSTSALGPKGCQALCGGSPVCRDTHDPAVSLTVTEEGRRWLSPAVASSIAAARAVVNRAPPRAQADLVIADSANGPYFSANHLGGSGNLWRIGAGVGEEDGSTSLAIVSAVIEQLALRPASTRTRIGLVSLTNGPERGNWSEVAVADWCARMRSVAARSGGNVAFVELASPREMLDAARSSDFLCILNPYGESIPLASGDGLPAVIDAIRGYVKAGGNWFEVGGYPFFQALHPVRYLSYSASYPVAFSDFLHLESRAGIAALYRAQPRTVKQPWDAAKNHDAIFVPGSLGCGGDERGGYCDHVFNTYVHAGETWHSPPVRMTIGTPVYEDLERYCTANSLTRPLADKMRPEILASLKKSVLLFYGGSCREKIDNLDRLPVPTLIHFSDYLCGGFDKQYPDHLPVRPDFGTEADFRTFFDRAHAMGHLISPYTNPTWWCDHPKGRTFEREGDAPLLKTLDGKPIYERYSKNDGWTITLWHPAVQAANRVTVRQFTKDLPVDILFQDQCGARGWHYDINPASPTPYAYSEGMIAMNDEDSRVVPLGTENGWDRVANYQVLLCGMSWGIVPTEHHPVWVRLFKASCPPDAWEIFPLAQAVAHDKVVFLHHDLGQFVTSDQTLSWSLGIGYSLSYRASGQALAQDSQCEWLAWLDRIQKSVCARYIGKPLHAFTHDRAPLFAAGGDPRRTTDDGVISATYGPVRIISNLGDVPRTIGGHTLAPYGFHASAPGMTAGLLAGRTGFVTETARDKTDVWVYMPAQSNVTVPVPVSGRVRLSLDGGPSLLTNITSGYLTIDLPSRGGKTRKFPLPEFRSHAPCDWSGIKPAIGIIDLGSGVSPALTSVSPAQWRAAFEASALAKQYGLSVKTLGSYDEIAAALAAGPRAWFVIINPYGEVFPAAGAGRWREALDAIHSYVNNGGTWWETAAYSLYRAVYREGNAWKSESCGSSGAGQLNLPVGAGEVDEAVQPLHATDNGKVWLGDALSAKINQSMSMVNRGTPSTESAPATVLVAGMEHNFIGGYRLDGWGYLWRIGGFNPNPDVTVSVAVAATLHQYTSVPEPLPVCGTRYLWHAQLMQVSMWQRFCGWF